MPPKPGPEPGEKKFSKFILYFNSIVYLKCVGGEVTAPAILAPKCSTLGVNPKVVGEAI